MLPDSIYRLGVSLLPSEASLLEGRRRPEATGLQAWRGHNHRRGVETPSPTRAAPQGCTQLQDQPQKHPATPLSSELHHPVMLSPLTEQGHWCWAAKAQLWAPRRGENQLSPATGTTTECCRAGQLKDSTSMDFLHPLAGRLACSGVLLFQQGQDAGTGSHHIPASQLASETAACSRPAAARTEQLLSAPLGGESAPSRTSRAPAALSCPFSPSQSSEQGGIGVGALQNPQASCNKGQLGKVHSSNHWRLLWLYINHYRAHCQTWKTQPKEIKGRG